MSPDRDNVTEACANLRRALNETRGMGRRELLTALAAFAGTSPLIATLCSAVRTPAAAAELPVTLFAFGGQWKQGAMTAFGDPFTAKTAIPMQYQEPYSFARIVAMHQAKAQQVDVFPAEGAEVILAERMNMLLPIDWSIVDRSHLSPEQQLLPHVVGSYTLAMVICYSKKKWPGEDHPKSWADFWNVDKFPGRRAVRRTPAIWTIDAALKADGVADADFYPLDADRAFRSLDRIKPHVKTWWSDNSQAQQLMAQEEVDLITMMNGRATELINKGAPYEIVWNEAITESDRQGWVVPTGSPNPKGGMQFIDFASRPEPQAVFARLLYYSPLNSKAFDLIEPELARQLPSYPANRKVAHILDAEWWADNYTQLSRRMEMWLGS
jgi:putative spermidine/putrescine transport system substrate-binding protein